MSTEQPYFTVKVTRCGECPHHSDEFDVCGKGSPSWIRDDLFEDNRNGITPTCPMWPQRVETPKD